MVETRDSEHAQEMVTELKKNFENLCVTGLNLSGKNIHIYIHEKRDKYKKVTFLKLLRNYHKYSLAFSVGTRVRTIN